eukprot:m.116308 g.116308  ORF g.116308 m.116308 type:complete len:96 (+) comp17175_c0_seq3:1337-1624(+)
MTFDRSVFWSHFVMRKAIDSIDVCFKAVYKCPCPRMLVTCSGDSCEILRGLKVPCVCAVSWHREHHTNFSLYFAMEIRVCAFIPRIEWCVAKFQE